MLCFNSHHVDHKCPTAPCHIDFKALEYLTKADREIWLNPLSASVSLVRGHMGVALALGGLNVVRGVCAVWWGASECLGGSAVLVCNSGTVRQSSKIGQG